MNKSKEKIFLNMNLETWLNEQDTYEYDFNQNEYYKSKFERGC